MDTSYLNQIIGQAAGMLDAMYGNPRHAPATAGVAPPQPGQSPIGQPMGSPPGGWGYQVGPSGNLMPAAGSPNSPRGPSGNPVMGMGAAPLEHPDLLGRGLSNSFGGKYKLDEGGGAAVSWTPFSGWERMSLGGLNDQARRDYRLPGPPDAKAMYDHPFGLNIDPLLWMAPADRTQAALGRAQRGRGLRGRDRLAAMMSEHYGVPYAPEVP